jgi:hypothetical protein
LELFNYDVVRKEAIGQKARKLPIGADWNALLWQKLGLFETDISERGRLQTLSVCYGKYLSKLYRV